MCNVTLKLTLVNKWTPLACVVCGVRFLSEGVFECDIADCRSMAVFCMLYKIRCNHLYGATNW